MPPGYDGRRVAERRITGEIPRRAIIVGSFQWIAKQMSLRDFVMAADPLFAAAGAELEIVGSGDPRFFEGLRAGLRATPLVGRVDSVELGRASRRARGRQHVEWSEVGVHIKK